MTQRLFSGLLVAAVCWCVSSHALGQGTAGRTIVVAVGQGEDMRAEQRTADVVERALAARGVPVLSMHEVRDRVLALSRPPATPDTTDLDVLAREARAALEHVTFGRSAAAKTSVKEVFRRAERALESLNRETQTARVVLDACLALVRNALWRGNREDAIAEAMRCRRLVPDVAPREASHPANVIGALAEADNQLRRMQIGRLSVDSVPESGCATYVNGRHLGVTPFRLDRAAAGEYRIQVECSQAPGRVHMVRLGDDPVSVRVDSEYDAALRSDGRVSLLYQGATASRTLAVPHAAELARSIGAEETVLITIRGEQAELSRVGVAQGALIGRRRLPLAAAQDRDSPELAEALDKLLTGYIAAEAKPEVEAPLADAVVEPESVGHQDLAAARDSAEPREQTDESRLALRTRRLRIAAASLSAAGVGLFVAGAVFEGQRRDADDRLKRLDPLEAGTDGPITQATDDYQRAQGLRWLAAGGSALLSAAAPMWRSHRTDGMPWWSYVVGAAGVGLASWGIFEVARDGECTLPLTTGGCARNRDSGGRGAMLLSAAAPLLVLPLDHVVEWRLSARKTSVAIAPGRSSTMLVLRGEL